MPAIPFTDPHRLAPLYATPDRLARRTGALHAAKISGEDATATITELAARGAPARPVVCDIGCGRGTTTIDLATRLAPRQVVAVDRSPLLLHTHPRTRRTRRTRVAPRATGILERGRMTPFVRCREGRTT